MGAIVNWEERSAEIGRFGEVVQEPQIVPMTQAEAREAVVRVQSHMQDMWYELKEIHDRRGWVALGYANFGLFCEGELHMSRSHVYRLIDAARLLQEMTIQSSSHGFNHLSSRDDTSGDTDIYRATVGQLRELKQLNEEVRQQISQQVEWGKTTMADIRSMAAAIKGVVEVESTHTCDRSAGRRYCPYCGIKLEEWEK